jgi:hypothetical protein
VGVGKGDAERDEWGGETVSRRVEEGSSDCQGGDETLRRGRSRFISCRGEVLMGV